MKKRRPRYILEYYMDLGGGYRWRLFSRTGNIVADSGEDYSTMSNARRAGRRLFGSVGPDSFEERTAEQLTPSPAARRRR